MIRITASNFFENRLSVLPLILLLLSSCLQEQPSAIEGTGGVNPPPPPAPSAVVFTPTGSMTESRANHSATLLPDGRVLIAGGYQTPNLSTQIRLSSAELYDPATRTFRPAAGNMSEPRVGHAATLLPNGKVLIVGGTSDTSAELFDPATESFSMTGAMETPEKSCLAATLLANGKVLVAKDSGAELYDPTALTFTAAGQYPFSEPCVETATLLADGRVLLLGVISVIGGDASQLYDPTTNSFSKITNAPLPLRNGIDLYTVTLLNNGRVLVAGGEDGVSRYSSVELYDPINGNFSAAGNMQYNRDAQAAALLPDGRVLVTGGDSWICGGGSCMFEGSLANAELYDPTTGAFSLVGSMNAARSLPTATLLKTGDVLVVGGDQYCGIGCFNGTLASAELYHP